MTFVVVVNAPAIAVDDEAIDEDAFELLVVANDVNFEVYCAFGIVVVVVEGLYYCW